MTERDTRCVARTRAGGRCRNDRVGERAFYQPALCGRHWHGLMRYLETGAVQPGVPWLGRYGHVTLIVDPGDDERRPLELTRDRPCLLMDFDSGEVIVAATNGYDRTYPKEDTK